MQSAGPIFAEAHRVAAPFADLARADGPFISMYLDTSPDVELAPTMIDTRWKNARRELLEQGAPEAILDEIAAHIEGSQLRGSTLAVISSFASVLHVDHHGEPPAYELSVVSSVPRLAPLLSWRQSLVPHVVVVADRTGADITGWLAEGYDISASVDSADAKAVTKVQPGGWSQPRYQRRVENAWEATASEVANVITGIADDVKAKVIAVAGDVRAVELLRKALPARIDNLVQPVDGSRANDGSDGALTDAARRCVATAAASETVELLRKFREERGQHDRAADGVPATAAALAQAQVETLLIHDDVDDDRELWFGPQPEQIGVDRDAVAGMGVDEPGTGRLVDVAIRAALGTGAGVWIVPSGGGPTDGIGAVLRWS